MTRSGEETSGLAVSGPRILYLSKHFGYPLGGVRIAHHHVSILRRNGFDARIVLIDDEHDEFFDKNDVVIERLSDYSGFSAGDIVVVPEPWHPFVRDAGQSPARSLVFCQNHTNVFYGLGRARSYADYGIDGVFCCSHVISRFLTEILGVEEAPVIRNAIDHTLFKPGPKRRQIAYMPRKMKHEAQYLVGLFRARYPRYREVPWIRIEKMNEREVADVLAASEIFVALGRNEGFGLPPIEAMASGCVVTGFVADGGRDYADRTNGFWSKPEDFIGVADGLASALDQVGSEDGHRQREAMMNAGIKTAAAYSFAGMEADLIAFWTNQVSIVTGRPVPETSGA